MKWVMLDSLCLFLSVGMSLEVLTVDLPDLKRHLVFEETTRPKACHAMPFQSHNALFFCGCKIG